MRRFHRIDRVVLVHVVMVVPLTKRIQKRMGFRLKFKIPVCHSCTLQISPGTTAFSPDNNVVYPNIVGSWIIVID